MTDEAVVGRDRGHASKAKAAEEQKPTLQKKAKKEKVERTVLGSIKKSIGGAIDEMILEGKHTYDAINKSIAERFKCHPRRVYRHVRALKVKRGHAIVEDKTSGILTLAEGGTDVGTD